MKLPIFHSRASLTATVFNNARWFTGLLATTAILGSSSADAGWTGTINTDWNNFGNWTGASGGSGTALVNGITANVATISANINPVPTAMLIGNTLAGQVNHVAGNASVSAANDLTLGRTTGGNGTYNLANTAAGGGILTGFGQGSGSLTIPDQIFVGGLINPGGIGTLNVNTTGTLAVGNQLLVGNLGGTGTVKMDSGTLTVVNDMEIGNGASSTGTFSMSGGTVTKSGASTAVTIGGGLAADGGTGTANLNGGTFTTAGVFRVGQDFNTASATTSNGTLNLAGTNLTVNGEFWIGNNTGATGTMSFFSGSLATNNWTLIGRKDDTNTGVGATGSVTMTNGTWTKAGAGNFVVGDTGAGTMIMSGGLVVVAPTSAADLGTTWIANRNNCTGTLSLSGTAEFRSSRFGVAVQTGTTGTLNLNSGGKVKTTGFTGGAGTSTVNFNGSQITATGNSGAFIETLTTANLNSGGLLVDTAGYNLTASQALAGSGGVVKTGAGTLSLTGANTYTGNHTVSTGKLAVSSASTGIGNFTVANGATMGVIQTTDTSALTVSNVTLGATGAASLDVELANAPNNSTVAPLNVTGTLTLNGLITLNVADLQPAVGPIPLVTYVGAKAGSGSFVLGSLPPGVTATLADNGTGLVSLTITDISFPLWRGTVNGLWDTATQNWIDQITSSPLSYKDPLPVKFDDSATGTTALTLNIPVSPGNVAFNNDTLTYTLGGTGKISGSTGLTKTGVAPLAINTVNNDYTGVTTLSGGTTTVGVLTNGGLASPLGAASSAAANLVLNGGKLEYTGGNVTSDRGLTISGVGSGILNASNLTLTGVIEGTSSGSLKKTGAGALSLTNAAVVLGGAGLINEVLAGTLSFSGPGQTASIPGLLYVGSAPNVPAHLVIENSNLTVAGIIALGRGNGDTGTVSTLSATNSVVQIGSFSTGFDAGLATNDSDQTITLNNTNWTTNGTTLLAEKQNSTTNMTLSGTTIYTAKSNIQMAINNTAVCNLTIQDTASLVHSGGWFSVGNDGTCTLTVKNNASLSTVNADFNISDIGTSTGTLNIQDNATVSATGTMFVGKNTGTTGTLNMTSGTLTAGTWLTTGRYVGGTGFFNLSGGTVNQTGVGQGFIVGENGTATLTVSGTGTLNIDGGGLYLSAEGLGTSHSVAYLNGGTIIAKRVVQREFNVANYTEFHFNGGILRAHSGASLDFMSNHDLVMVDSGGAFIDSNAQTITIAQALGGSGGLTKQGAGTLTLSGANTYAGSTTVSAGTLSLSTAYLSNTSTVTIAAGAVLNLNYAGTDQVGGLTIGVTPLAIGIYDATTNPGVITGTGKLQVTATASPYVAWINGFPSIPLADRDPGDDPDNDGSTNAVEFALGGIPNNGSNNPKVYSIVADSSADGDTISELLMTIAVRIGTPSFIGSPSPSATQDGFTYKVQGSNTLSSFAVIATPVNLVAPPAPNAAPPTGYEYRTFSLSGSNGTTGKGFLRVSIENP